MAEKVRIGYDLSLYGDDWQRVAVVFEPAPPVWGRLGLASTVQPQEAVEPKTKRRFGFLKGHDHTKGDQNP